MAGTEQRGLRESAGPLVEGYDTVLLDLDGVVYIGPDAVPGAVEAVEGAGRRGARLAYVTNNAARPPGDVAEHLRELGIRCADEDVVTSAQAAATLLAEDLPPGSPVLVVGGEGLVRALEEVGLRAVGPGEDDPVSVVSGFSPEMSWRLLAEGTYAVRAGLPWVATNLDRTVPTPRGAAPGNGALVRLVADAAGREPDRVAGKPERPLLDEALRRSGARSALFVGDRLDTDVEGARAAGVDCLLVLTGVSTPVDLVGAAPERRPDFVAADLGGLVAPQRAPEESERGWVCGGWTARVGKDGGIAVAGTGEAVDGIRALCAAVWSGAAGTVTADAIRRAVRAVGWPEPDER